MTAKMLDKVLQGTLQGAAALSLVAGPAFAQVGQGTQIYWNASRMDVATGVAAITALSSTITITPQAGQYVYLTGMDISACSSVAVTAVAPAAITTTNMNGVAWQVGSGSTTVGGTCIPTFVQNFGPGGLKAAAPGAVTIASSVFATNESVRANFYWYSGY